MKFRLVELNGKGETIKIYYVSPTSLMKKILLS